MRRRLVGSTLVALVAGVLFATGALASSSHHSRTRHDSSPAIQFSVLARLHSRAKVANGPAKGALAAVFPSDGVENKLYVSEESGEYCLTMVQNGGLESQGCALPEVANVKGIELVLGSAHMPTTIALLLPNGVNSATFTDTDGATHVVDVHSNVVALSDADVASASYTMPGGVPESVKVPPAPTAP